MLIGMAIGAFAGWFLAQISDHRLRWLSYVVCGLVGSLAIMLIFKAIAQSQGYDTPITGSLAGNGYILGFIFAALACRKRLRTRKHNDETAKDDEVASQSHIIPDLKLEKRPAHSAPEDNGSDYKNSSLSDAALLAYEYDEHVKNVVDRLERKSKNLGVRAAEIFVSQPDISAEEAESNALEEWERDNSPFSEDIANQEFRRLSKIDPKLAEEFRSAYNVLGKRSDATSIARKIEDKFSRGSVQKSLPREQLDPERAIKQLALLGYKVKPKGMGYIIEEPLGGRQGISSENDLIQYASDKISRFDKDTIKPSALDADGNDKINCDSVEISVLTSSLGKRGYNVKSSAKGHQVTEPLGGKTGFLTESDLREYAKSRL